MSIVIDDDYSNVGFVGYLKKKLIVYILANLNPKKLCLFDDVFSGIYGKNVVSARRAIILGVSNMVATESGGNTVLSINESYNYPGTETRLVDICKMINYGCMEADPYPIFTMAFNHFNSKIDYYAEQYSEIGVI